MTKRPADAFPTLSLRESDHHWVTRGYRPELANSRRSPNEDPLGEIAYQRAFADAAKHKPPRVPNPDFFPNSPSALKYIKQRAETMFSEKKTSQPNTPASASSPPTHQDRHPSPRSDHHHRPNSNVNINLTHSPAVHTPTNSYQFSPTTSRSTTSVRPFHSAPPEPVEPKLAAPIGPPKTFR